MNRKIASLNSANIKNKKVVFVGPFVGEFGWELLFWHGWVKKIFRTRYRNYHKIACSVPGRHVFYPDADEFLPLPISFFKKPFSSRGYITDCWINGWPKPNASSQELEDVYPKIEKILREFKRKLPKDTEFIVPWQKRKDPEYGIMGAEIPENPTTEIPVSYEIPYSNQILEYFKPTRKGKQMLEKIRKKDKRKPICIFPRMRKYRRPDKNWDKEKYLALIQYLQGKFPDYKIAILGEPRGAFFADFLPKDCLDLINVDPNYRMDVQCAALRDGVIAIGSQSGAIDFALGSGCCSITWGTASGEKRFLGENYMKTPLTFLPVQNPSSDIVIKYVEKMLGVGRAPVGFEVKKQMISNFYKIMPDSFMKSKRLSKLKKKIS